MWCLLVLRNKNVNKSTYELNHFEIEKVTFIHAYVVIVLMYASCFKNKFKILLNIRHLSQHVKHVKIGTQRMKDPKKNSFTIFGILYEFAWLVHK
jgi:hypothetical protein